MVDADMYDALVGALRAFQSGKPKHERAQLLVAGDFLQASAARLLLPRISLRPPAHTPRRPSPKRPRLPTRASTRTRTARAAAPRQRRLRLHAPRLRAAPRGRPGGQPARRGRRVPR
eukprot:6343564-Prymnesium_polylepis.1